MPTTTTADLHDLLAAERFLAAEAPIAATFGRIEEAVAPLLRAMRATGRITYATDPERGWALAALTGVLSFEAAKPAFIRKAVESRVDPNLFALSYDFVGDLAETVALIWPSKPGANREPELPEVVDALRSASRNEVQRRISWRIT